jgi:hypothetical protein
MSEYIKREVSAGKHIRTPVLKLLAGCWTIDAKEFITCRSLNKKSLASIARLSEYGLVSNAKGLEPYIMPYIMKGYVRVISDTKIQAGGQNEL